ncbi:MAG: hypothetical protein LM553_00330 [Desulfurococcaceae archaeon]|nr:hypothetical protein [Desulfurococcaceae archaeon]MCC6054645.1 hypothetical protein [Thermosphaera sp.]
MSLHDILSSLKNLVDDYETVIDKGKLAVKTEDVESVMVFINGARSLMERVQLILPSVREVLNAHGEGDKLVKYINVFYRMLVYVSIPYTLEVMEEAMNLLDRKGYITGVVEVKEAINMYESLMDTLKSK